MNTDEAPKPVLLVVEDEPDALFLLVLIFRREGFVVHQATDGEMALKALAEGCDPHVIVTDLMMPKLDGRGLIKQLREHPLYSLTPTVLVSASPVYDTGADEVVEKPFQPDHIAAIVRRCAEREMARRS